MVLVFGGCLCWCVVVCDSVLVLLLLSVCWCLMLCEHVVWDFDNRGVSC